MPERFSRARRSCVRAAVAVLWIGSRAALARHVAMQPMELSADA